VLGAEAVVAAARAGGFGRVKPVAVVVVVVL